MNQKLAWLTLSLLVLNMLTAFLIVPTENVKADPPLEGDNWWIYPETVPKGVIYQSPSFNWTKFWKVFKNHALWGLEYNDGSGWEWVNQSLTVGKKSVGDNGKKLWLNFTAPYTGDYRLTFAINYKVKQYLEKIGQYAYNLSFEKFGETFNVTFDFSDIAAVPGIILNHGVVTRNSNKYFYLRARKNNINQGVSYSIDPSYTVFSGAGVYAAYTNSPNLVRCSNGTWYCTFWESNDIQVAWSEDDGETWTNKEIYGDYSWSRGPTIAVDSNDTIHLVWVGYSDADFNDRQVRYCNSTNWGSIADIVNADFEHYWPSIAIDSKDNIYVVYELDDADSEIGFLKSTNNGWDWTDPTYITSETDASDDNWYPTLDIDSNDNLHVTYTWENGIGGRDAIMHMQSTDGGTTWSDWDGDTALYLAGYDTIQSTMTIDDNDKLHVAARCKDLSASYDAIIYSHNDSSGWSNYEQVTSADSNDQQRPSISNQGDNDFIHVAWRDNTATTGIDYSYNDTIEWSAKSTIFSTDANYASLIDAQHPTVGGVKICRPKTGFAFVCSVSNANVTFYKSNDLAFGADAVNTAPFTSGEAPGNGTTNVVRQTPCKDLYVIITDNDGDTLNVTWWSNHSGTWAKFGTNLSETSGTNITQCNSNFTDWNTKYWWSANVSDGEGGWTNDTFHFTIQPETPPSEEVYFSNPSITNNSNDNEIDVFSYSVYINNTANKKMWYNITMYDSYNIKTFTSTGNSLNHTIFHNITNCLWLGYNYTIWFNITNITGVKSHRFYEFRTIETIASTSNGGGGGVSGGSNVIGLLGLFAIPFSLIFGLFFKRRKDV